MPDPEKPEGGAPSVEKLTEQVENLNKGIASYRDKADTAEKVAKEATAKVDQFAAEIERLKTESNKSKDDKKSETQLAPSDAEKLEAWAKAQGFVKKEELEVEKAKIFNESLKNIESQAIDEFVKTHPEYNNDDEWSKIKEQFNLYKQPTSLTGYRQVLAKIHKELRGSDEAAAKARAAEENRKRLNLGGGSGGGAESDTTLESLREKYPSLSTDQIQARLEEINQLAKSREDKVKAREKAGKR